jgi:hypothetical protein
MTDDVKKRFAFFDMNVLKNKVNAKNNLNNFLSYSSDLRGWEHDIQLTNTLPKSYLSSLGFEQQPVEILSTDIYANKLGGQKVFVSNTNQIRVFDGDKFFQIKFEAQAKNFIPSRDITLDLHDLIVFDGDAVSVFRKE